MFDASDAGDLGEVRTDLRHQERRQIYQSCRVQTAMRRDILLDRAIGILKHTRSHRDVCCEAYNQVVHVTPVKSSRSLPSLDLDTPRRPHRRAVKSSYLPKDASWQRRTGRFWDQPPGVLSADHGGLE